VLGRGREKSNPKNAIAEQALRGSWTLWCGATSTELPEPQEVPGMAFHVLQPGSSVATSLIEGEAKAKHVVLLEVEAAPGVCERLLALRHGRGFLTTVDGCCIQDLCRSHPHVGSTVTSCGLGCI